MDVDSSISSIICICQIFSSFLSFYCFHRQPTREDIVNIVYGMYEKDGLSREDVVAIVDLFPNQGSVLSHDI